MPRGTISTNTTRMAPSTRLELKTCCVPISVVSHWIATQPTTGPISVPSPPTITQMMICADCARPKMVGLVKAPQLANRQPASPAMAPPSVKQNSL